MLLKERVSNLLDKVLAVDVELEITEHESYCIIYVIICNPIHFIYELDILPLGRFVWLTVNIISME